MREDDLLSDLTEAWAAVEDTGLPALARLEALGDAQRILRELAPILQGEADEGR